MPAFVFRAIAAFACVIGLAGCIDASLDIEVLGPNVARATTVETVGPDYAALVASGEIDLGRGEDFCANGDLSDTLEGGIECVTETTGRFATLDLGSFGTYDPIRFSTPGRRLVRVSFRTADLAAELRGAESLSSEHLAMTEALFAGRTLKLKVSGGPILTTNMVREDGAAVYEFDLIDLMSLEADLPPKLFAVIRLNPLEDTP